MSTTGRPSRSERARTAVARARPLVGQFAAVARPLVRRLAAMALVVLVVLTVGLAVIAKPPLVVTLILSIAAGALFRIGLTATLVAWRPPQPRSTAWSDRASWTSRASSRHFSLESLQHSREDAAVRRPEAVPAAPRRSRRALAGIAGAALVAGVGLVLVGLMFFHSRQVDLTPARPTGPPKLADRPHPTTTTIHRYRYASTPTLERDGSWTGDEVFTLTLAEAKELVGNGTGAIADRLQAVVPGGWVASKDVGGGKVKYRLTRSYSTANVGFHWFWPLTSGVSLPAPELDAKGLRHVLFAAEGSTMTLTAPKRRIYDTAPASKAEPDGRWEVRTVKLDVVGPAAAGSGVDLEVESDLAMHVEQATLGQGFTGFILALVALSGITIGSLRKGLWSLLKRLFKRDAKRKRTPQILRGRRDMHDALVAYLHREGITADDEITEAVATISVEAGRLAKAAIKDSDDPKKITKAYNQAHSAFVGQGISSLDAVHRALRASGLPSEQLTVIDAKLDDLIATTYAHDRPEPAPRPVSV